MVRARYLRRGTPSSWWVFMQLAALVAASSVGQTAGICWALGGKATAHTRTRSEATALGEATAESEEGTGGVPGRPGERLREGTRLVEVVGTFQAIGADGITFSPRGSKDSYRVLENLALERIGRTLDETRGTRMWVVSGLITEYRGANYLLVSKAVMQAEESGVAR